MVYTETYERWGADRSHGGHGARCRRRPRPLASRAALPRPVLLRLRLHARLQRPDRPPLLRGISGGAMGRGGSLQLGHAGRVPALCPFRAAHRPALQAPFRLGGGDAPRRGGRHAGLRGAGRRRAVAVAGPRHGGERGGWCPVHLAVGRAACLPRSARHRHLRVGGVPARDGGGLGPPGGERSSRGPRARGAAPRIRRLPARLLRAHRAGRPCRAAAGAATTSPGA